MAQNEPLFNAVAQAAQMSRGDDQTGMRGGNEYRQRFFVFIKTDGVPQKCGTYEIIEKRYHKYHNVVRSVVLICRCIPSRILK